MPLPEPRFFFNEPQAQALRPAWAEVPHFVRQDLEAVLGESIVDGQTAQGGYSPSAAFFLTLRSGKKIFVKGTHPGDDTHGTQSLRQEILAYQAIPGIETLSPAYLGRVGGAEEDGWMLAAFDAIATVPTLPWDEEKTVSAIHLLSRIWMTPAEAAPAVPRMEDRAFVKKFLRAEGGWLRLLSDAHAREKFLSLFVSRDDGQAWLGLALPRFCALQEKVEGLNAQCGVLHQDIRSDNFLFDQDRRAYLIDWQNACFGPVVFDAALFLGAVIAESGRTPEDLFPVLGRESPIVFDSSELSVALTSLSGHMADQAYRAVPPKLPRLRWMQKNLLLAVLALLCRTTGLLPPPPLQGQIKFT